MPDGERILAILRGRIQLDASTAYIFLGSIRNRMTDIFWSPDSPFYHSAAALPVGEIDGKDFLSFLQGRFATGGRRLPKEMFDKIAILARNYALVTVSDWTDQDATQPTFAEDGRRVPPIPHEWIRNAALAVLPSLAYATPEEFAAAAWSRPSPWGKPTALWEDYVAGTNPDPAGPDSTFRITSIVVTNGVPALTWSPDLGAARRYTVEGKVRLDDKNEPWQTPLPPGARFFKVKVSLP